MKSLYNKLIKRLSDLSYYVHAQKVWPNEDTIWNNTRYFRKLKAIYHKYL